LSHHSFYIKEIKNAKSNAEDNSVKIKRELANLRKELEKAN